MTLACTIETDSGWSCIASLSIPTYASAPISARCPGHARIGISAAITAYDRIVLKGAMGPWSGAGTAASKLSGAGAKVVGGSFVSSQ